MKSDKLVVSILDSESERSGRILICPLSSVHFDIVLSIVWIGLLSGPGGDNEK